MQMEGWYQMAGTINFIHKKGYPEVYHDQAVYFVSIAEPKAGDKLTVRLRAGKGELTKATLQYMLDNRLVCYPMVKVENKFEKTDCYEFWETTFVVPETVFFYCFLIESELDGKQYYYTQRTNYADEEVMTGDNPYDKEETCKNGWQILPGFCTPEWAKGLVWYSLAPDAFYNGDPTNDDMQSEENYDQPWNILHYTLRDRYGGDLQGIMDKADYFTDLGVDGVFYNPIQKSEQNMGYGTTDYDQIESTFGNADKYGQFIRYMHSKGLRLMQDVVLYFSPMYSMYVNAYDRWPHVGVEPLDGSTELNSKSPFYSMINDADGGGLKAWDGYVLNHTDPVTKELIYESPESALQRYIREDAGFGVDGYRFDCGGWITGHAGTTDTYPYTEEEKAGRHVGYHINRVTRHIRETLKKVNPEFDMLSESSGRSMEHGAFDSQWVIGLNQEFEKFLKGELSANKIRDMMVYMNLWCQPRGTLECSKLQVNTHDENSNNLKANNYAAWRSARLIQMTYIGSPSIYYGEENNFSGCKFTGGNGHDIKGFSYFDWDESKWDYKMRNFFKALIELRKQYPLLKKGAFVELGYNAHVVDFARFDEKNAVITFTSIAEEAQEHIVNAASAGISDGAVLTDWFTGETHTVEGGKLKILVQPGGTILVTGGKTATFRLGYGIADLQQKCSADCTDIVSNEGKKTIVMSDERELENCRFVHIPTFDSFTYELDVELDANAKAVVMVRNSLDISSPIYVFAVESDEEKKQHHIKILRSGANQFSVWDNGELVEEATSDIAMNDKVLVGFSTLRGTAAYSAEQLVTLSRPLADDFTSDEITSMFNDVENANVSDGVLCVQPGSMMTTRSCEDDWTFKAKLSYLPKTDGDYAGVISRQDDKNYVIAGKRFVDGVSKLFFAKTSCGELVIEQDEVDLHPEKDVIIQLQRIGTAYSVIYSYDENNWKALGNSVFMNLSVEMPGVASYGNEIVYVDYVSFGDAINDGKSIFTPHAPNVPASGLTETKYVGCFKWTFASGDWEKAPEGYRQTSLEESQLAVCNKKYTDFRAEASFTIDNGDGFVGMSFGKSEYDSPIDSGYTLRYTAEQRIELAKGNTILIASDVSKIENQLRLVLEVKSDRAVVYAGQDALPVIQTTLSGYEEGYFSFCSDRAAGTTCNFNICSANAALYSTHMGYTSTASDITITGDGTENVFLRGYAFTDYELTTKVTMRHHNTELYAHSGLLLSNYYGISLGDEKCGLYLCLDSEGKIRFIEHGVDIYSSYALEETAAEVTFKVIKLNKKYSIYINQMDAPIFEHAEDVERGSVYGVSSYNSNTVFSDITIKNL